MSSDTSRFGREVAETVQRSIAEKHSKPGAQWTVTAHTDRVTALKGADYLVNSIEV